MSKDKENTTKNFALRLDAKTMEAVEKWAADEFRSVNGQIQWIINEALKKNKRLWTKAFGFWTKNLKNIGLLSVVRWLKKSSTALVHSS